MNALGSPQTEEVAAAGQPVGRIAFALLVVASYLAPGFFSFPQDAVVDNRLAAWPALLFALLMLTTGFASVLGLSERLPRLRLVGIHRRVLGGVLGTAAAGAVLVVDVLLAAVLLRDSGLLIKAMFLFLTPLPVLTFLTIIVAAYTAAPGAQTLGRALPLLVVGILVLGAAFLALGTKDVPYPWAILPHAFPLKSGAIGSVKVLYVLFGYQQIFNLRPFLHKEDQRHAAAWLWWGFALVCGLMVGTMAVTLGTLTPQGTVRFLWATAAVMRLIRAPGFFIARIGLAIMAGWSAVTYTYLAVHLWGEAASVRDLFGVDQVDAQWLVWVMAGVVWAVATWAWPNELSLLRFLHGVLDPTGLALLICLPLGMGAVASVRGLRA